MNNAKRKLKLADKLPISQLLPDGKTIVTKSLNLCQVIYIQGTSFSGMEEDDIESLIKARVAFYKEMPEKYRLTFHYQRKHVEYEEQEIDFPNSVLKRIHDKQKSLIRDSYKTDIFLVITDTDGEKLKGHVTEEKIISSVQSRLNDMDVKVSEIESVLTKYGAHVISNDKKSMFNVLDFWSYIINGGRRIDTPKQIMYLNNILAITNLEFDLKKGHIIFDESGEKRYGAILRLNMFPDETYQELLDTLSQVRHKFSIIQYVSVHDDEKIMTTLSKDFNKLKSAIDNKVGETLNLFNMFKSRLSDLGEAMEVVGTHTRLAQHTFAVHVYGDTLDQLNGGIQLIKNALAQNNIMCVPETDNLEHAYWQQFPDLEYLNKAREFTVTTHDVANFITLSKTSEGFDRCSWGLHPVSTFLTREKTAYNFTFHKSDATDSATNGNTLIIGGTGSGKTTFMMSLALNSLKYHQMKILLLDSGQGCRIPVKSMDGDYINISDPSNLPMNPFLMPKNEANQSFLERWVVALCGGSDSVSDRERITIAEYIKSTFDLDDKQVNLASAFDIITNLDYEVRETSLADRLQKWIPDFNGDDSSIYAQYFNAKKDALNFNKQIVAFDMKKALDDRELLVPLSMYIFHAFAEAINQNPSPNIMIVDELRQYLQNPIIGEYISHTTEEIRKRNGIFIGAMQDPSHLDGKYRKSILTNISTMIFLPSDNANWSAYKDLVNEAEFDWIKNTFGKRQALIKKNGQSIIIDVDFSYMGSDKYLFSGDFKHAKLMAEMEKKYPDSYDERIAQFLKRREEM